ncbi:MAG: hypothetical protein JWM28_932 [Chitinophagaceae bacterium]|nr:hypothetical protein [Chitinophagaceae bacterium]
MLNQQSHGQNEGHTGHVLPFTVDGTRFEWEKQYINGEEIRKLAGLSDHSSLWLKIDEPWDDEVIGNTTLIDLARPEVEHFISTEREKVVTIIINGTPFKWDKKEISFREVIEKAYGTYIDSPTMVYTAGYEDGPKKNPEGEMKKGQSVFVKNKMIFHATCTDKS